MDENPYKSPLGPLTKPHRVPVDWTLPALVLIVLYAAILILVMLRTAYGT